MPCPSNTMQVAIVIRLSIHLRHIEVDDKLDEREVEPPSEEISSYNYLDVAISELPNALISLFKLHGAQQEGGREALLSQLEK